MSLLSWAIMPSILLVIVIYLSDRFKEPIRHVIVAFLLGVGFVVALYVLIEIVNYLFLQTELFDVFSLYYNEEYDIAWGWEQKVWFHLIRASFLEELCKFSVLYLYCMKFKSFNEPFDAIIYGVAISLGFSAFENIDYVTSSGDGIIRIFPTLMHASTGVMMGLLLSKYLMKEQSNLFRLFLSLQIPVLMHGFYNLTTYSMQFISVVIIFVVVSMTIIVIQRNRQKYKLWEQELIFKHSNIEFIKSIFIVLLSTIFICLILTKVF